MSEFTRLTHNEALNELAARLRGDLPWLCAETARRIEREHPETLRGLDRGTIEAGIEATHARFIDVVAGSEDAGRGAPDHVALGAAVARAGIGMEALMAGYRQGAIVGWEAVAAHAAELDTPADQVARLAAASLAYMDELGGNSLEGYEREAAASHSARSRARQALLDALMDGAPEASAPETAALAAAAGWDPPELVVAVVPTGRLPALDEERVLLGTHAGRTVGVADAAHVPALMRGGGELAIGRAGPAAHTARSLAGARGLAALGHPGVHRWEDHLTDLAVSGDADAGRALSARRLAPLEALPDARAELLTETLAAWLGHPNSPSRIAAELGLHPQTVRYRLARLREHLGDALDDPAERFELGLALRVRALGRGQPGPGT